jgi:hypothetical protein
MSKYYYLICAFPNLAIGIKPDLSFSEMELMLKWNLSDKDWEKFFTFRLYTDLKNLRSFLMKKPIDPRGNLDEKGLEEALMLHDVFPEYVFEYLEREESINYQLAHFPYLFAKYLQEEMTNETGFLQDFFSFERDFRLILTALRAKTLHRDIAFELQYEDPKEDLAADILAQKDLSSYTPPEEYLPIKHWYDQYLLSPKKLHEAFLNYRFMKVQEMTENHPFSIDQILAYASQLTLIEDWNQLNQEEANKTVASMLKDG